MKKSTPLTDAALEQLAEALRAEVPGLHFANLTIAAGFGVPPVILPVVPARFAPEARTPAHRAKVRRALKAVTR